MDPTYHGRPRSPGIDILLFVVTLGVYWIYWIYAAFKEVARREQKPFNAGPYVASIAVLYATGVGLTVYEGAKLFRETFEQIAAGGPTASPGANPFQATIEDAFTPLSLVAAGIGIVLHLIQLGYLMGAERIVREAVVPAGENAMPHASLVVVFNILYMVDWLPFLGTVAGLGAIVVAIIWTIQIQTVINRYWSRAAMPAPPPGFAPPVQPAAMPMGYGPRQM